MIRLGESAGNSSVPAQTSGAGLAARRRSLSARETTVLRHVATGKRNKEIAAELFITERTVKFHVSSLMAKLGARNRTEVVKVAANLRLISL